MQCKIFLTKEELAEQLSVRPGTIARWGAEGKIPRIVISPRIIRYDLEAVQAALAAEHWKGGGR